MKSTVNLLKRGQIEAFNEGTDNPIQELSIYIQNGFLFVEILFQNNQSISDNVAINSEDNYVNDFKLNTTTGDITISRTGTLSNLSINLDERYLMSIPSTYLTQEQSDIRYAYKEHEHPEYESFTTVVEVAKRSLNTIDKEGLIEYLKTIDIPKKKGETIIFHIVDSVTPLITITDPVEGQELYPTFSISFNTNSTFININETEATPDSISVSFKLE